MAEKAETKERIRAAGGALSLEERVWKEISEQEMLRPGDRVVVGVSGGGDSMALLSLLWSLKERGDFQVAALHVNHGFRGEEADRDQRLAEELCRERGIPMKAVCVNVRALAKKEKLGEEEAGRLVRQRELSAYVREWGGNKIALAHHANDQAETVLHHLARGSGLRGLGGMAAVSGMVIRPFLRIEKEEIDQYLKENGIPWAQDATNFSQAYTRNRIRLHLVEDLKGQVNQRAVVHIGEAAAIAREADDYLLQQGESHLAAFSKEIAKGILLAEEFFAAPSILQVYGILAGLDRLSHSRRNISREHLLRVAGLSQKPVGKALVLPGGLRAVRTYEGVLLCLCDQALKVPFRPRGQMIDDRMQERGEERELILPGECFFDGGRVICRIFPYHGEEVVRKKYTKWFDYDKIDRNIQIRYRKAGDFLTVAGAGKKKKLKDYFINEKIPQGERDILPLICQGAEVLWVVGYRRGESARVTPRTRTVLEIIYEGGSLCEREHSGIDQ